MDYTQKKLSAPKHLNPINSNQYDDNKIPLPVGNENKKQLLSQKSDLLLSEKKRIERPDPTVLEFRRLQKQAEALLHKLSNHKNWHDKMLAKQVTSHITKLTSHGDYADAVTLVKAWLNYLRFAMTCTHFIHIKPMLPKLLNRLFADNTIEQSIIGPILGHGFFMLNDDDQLKVFNGLMKKIGNSNTYSSSIQQYVFEALGQCFGDLTYKRQQLVLDRLFKALLVAAGDKGGSAEYAQGAPIALSYCFGALSNEDQLQVIDRLLKALRAKDVGIWGNSHLRRTAALALSICISKLSKPNNCQIPIIISALIKQFNTSISCQECDESRSIAEALGKSVGLLSDKHQLLVIKALIKSIPIKDFLCFTIVVEKGLIECSNNLTQGNKKYFAHTMFNLWRKSKKRLQDVIAVVLATSGCFDILQGKDQRQIVDHIVKSLSQNKYILSSDYIDLGLALSRSLGKLSKKDQELIFNKLIRLLSSSKNARVIMHVARIWSEYLDKLKIDSYSQKHVLDILYSYISQCYDEPKECRKEIIYVSKWLMSTRYFDDLKSQQQELLLNWLLAIVAEREEWDCQKIAMEILALCFKKQVSKHQQGIIIKLFSLLKFCDSNELPQAVANTLAHCISELDIDSQSYFFSSNKQSLAVNIKSHFYKELTSLIFIAQKLLQNMADKKQFLYDLLLVLDKRQYDSIHVNNKETLVKNIKVKFKSHHVSSLYSLLQVAPKGQPKVQHELGKRYAYGQDGANQDSGLACYWLQLAATQQYQPAITLLQTLALGKDRLAHLAKQTLIGLTEVAKQPLLVSQSQSAPLNNSNDAVDDEKGVMMNSAHHNQHKPSNILTFPAKQNTLSQRANSDPVVQRMNARSKRFAQKIVNYFKWQNNQGNAKQALLSKLKVVLCENKTLRNLFVQEKLTLKNHMIKVFAKTVFDELEDESVEDLLMAEYKQTLVDAIDIGVDSLPKHDIQIRNNNNNGNYRPQDEPAKQEGHVMLTPLPQ